MKKIKKAVKRNTVNKAEIIKQIKSLEEMKNCTTKEFNMFDYVAEGTVCETAVCIAGDVMVRKYGVEKVRDMIGEKSTSYEERMRDLQKQAGEILGLPRPVNYYGDYSLFHVRYWSGFNRTAYYEAKTRNSQTDMINAAIAELATYL